MRTTVTVGKMGRDSVPDVVKVFTEFDSTVSPDLTGLRRRQLYTYYDVFVHIQDFLGEDGAVSGGAADDSRIARLGEDLAPFVTAYDPAVSAPPSDASASRFYHWEGAPVDSGKGLHSTVIVNRVASAVIPEVARLFGELDATDFPFTMGTRRRQLFEYGGVYFHIQDFELENGYALIDQAWKEADPRFIKICEELDPLVKKYDPDSWRSTADQVATRFYRWEASA